MKFLLVYFSLMILLMAETVLPSSSIKASGGVVDMMYQNNLLYVATKESCVNIIDLKKEKIIRTIYVDKIKDFLGELVNAKVYSVDVIESKILLLSQTKQGYRRIHIEDKGVLNQIISYSDGLSIAKAKFLDKDTILLATLSSEIISFDINTKKKNWLVKASGATFSDFALNEEKSKVVIADESGALKILDTLNGKHLQTLEGQNLDNVFQVDYKDNIIVTAGKDRRMVVYDMKTSQAYYKTSSFLIYSVGLSPSANLVAYSSGEDNDIEVINRKTKAHIGTYGGNKMTINSILFSSENSMIVASENEIINLYQIGK